ncbi:hypothetical protein AMTR_s00158p00084960 [Amborella trichopoda]|uniref:Uncharacterized protein n=1 Tax=Amborella trichopoda TaxID=13333 RepID=W1PSY1_AMBTC|nr:hypothetical protein AMTR_s00158p00084960 [Amborella trichopoda]
MSAVVDTGKCLLGSCHYGSQPSLVVLDKDSLEQDGVPSRVSWLVDNLFFSVSVSLESEGSDVDSSSAIKDLQLSPEAHRKKAKGGRPEVPVESFPTAVTIETRISNRKLKYRKRKSRQSDSSGKLLADSKFKISPRPIPIGCFPAWTQICLPSPSLSLLLAQLEYFRLFGALFFLCNRRDIDDGSFPSLAPVTCYYHTSQAAASRGKPRKTRQCFDPLGVDSTVSIMVSSVDENPPHALTDYAFLAQDVVDS